MTAISFFCSNKIILIEIFKKKRKAEEDLLENRGRLNTDALKENSNINDGLEKLIKQKQQDRKAKIAFKEIILSILFALLSMLCAYQMLDNNTFTYQQNLRNMFGAGDMKKTLYDVI